MPAPLRLHFDFLSPYAYLAWKALPALAARHGRAIEPVPVLLAGLLHHHGNVGPAEVPAKRVYVFRDALRSAAVLGLPLEPPPTHPFRPLAALRLCCLELSADLRTRLVDRLFDATWAGGGGVEDPAVLARICADLGLPDALDAIQEPAVKARLRAHTEGAIAEGVFGVPTILADGEMFFGYDSFGHLDRFLAGEGPDLSAALDKWADLPSSAQRRR